MFDKERFQERLAAAKERRDARPTWIKVLIWVVPVVLALACWVNLRAMRSDPDPVAVTAACPYLRVEDIAGVFEVRGATLTEEPRADVSGIPVYRCVIASDSTLKLRLDVENHGGKPQTVVVAMAVSKQASYTTSGTDAELSVVKQVDGKFYVLKLAGSQDGAPITEMRLATMASLVTGRF